jgi:hypothetical protein
VNYIYQMKDGRVERGYQLSNAPAEWQVAAVADVTGDGSADIIWRNAQTGLNWVHGIANGSIHFSRSLNIVPVGQGWELVMAGDFNADRYADLLWRNSITGDNYVYFMREGVIRNVKLLNTDQNSTNVIVE